jgi:hypothetical protein
MKNSTTQKPGYESHWGSLLNFISNYNNDHNSPSLKDEWIALNKFEIGPYSNSHFNQLMINGNITITPTLEDYIKYKQEYIYSQIESLTTEETDCVIELGSGWGRNIIGLHLLNPEWKLYAGELTVQGSNTLNYFIDKFNLSKIETFSFNWCNTDSFYEFFKNKNFKEIVIYSFHSIEQVSYIEIEQIEKILNLPFNIKFFHVEPCAPQWETNKVGNPKGWNENYKFILDELLFKDKIKNLTADPKGFKPNFQGSGNESIVIKYEKK